MSLSPEEQAELDALLAQENTYKESQQANATFIDVAPYFYNNQLPNKLNDGYDYETNFSDYVPGPGFFTYAAPLAGALTPSIADRLMKDKKLYPAGEDGKKIKGSDPIANPQQVLDEARSVAQKDFESVRDADVENIRQEVDVKRNALTPEISKAQVQIGAHNQEINNVKQLFNSAQQQGDVDGMAQHELKLRNLESNKAQKVNELNSLNAQMVEADGKISSAQNAQMTAAQAIDADTKALASMGVSAPDVSRELQAGDIDVARKKMADHLTNAAKSRMARLVDFTKQIKSGKQILFDPEGKFRPTRTTKGGAATGLGAGFLVDTVIDFIGSESINLEEEQNKVGRLLDMAERYGSPFSGPDQTLLDPQKYGPLIKDIKDYHNDPSGKGYLLKQNAK